MEITGYTLPLVQHPQLDKMYIHPHQAEMLDNWDKQTAFLLVTKTGSGKTAAVTLPIGLNRDKADDNGAVFVYPTNELMRDQARSIVGLLEHRLGLKVKQITPDDNDDTAGDEDIILVQANADFLADLCQKWGYFTKHGKPNKSKALEQLLRPDKPKILLTNPDILYLLYSLKWGREGASALAHLSAYQTIVFDEFHLYQGVELAHVLYLIHVARQLGSFKRVVLLSATPHAEVKQWIDKLLQPYPITMEATVAYPQMGEREVAYQVNLTTLNGSEVIHTALSKISELKDKLQELRRENQNADYVPLVVILNSVIKATMLEDELCEKHGFTREQIMPIRGRTHRKVRNLDKKPLLIVGTSAIEVGIDFKCDYLIFEAGDAASFMQRFGRLGRHQVGQAFLLSDYREGEALKSLGETISRVQLEEAINRIYTQANARAWFVGTDLGIFAALSLSFNLQQAIMTERDYGPEADTTKHEITEFINRLKQEYATQMGLKITKIERWFRDWQNGKGAKWVNDYLAIDSFRTSLPSVEVYDVMEAQRRDDKSMGRYAVDIKSLLSRADAELKEGQIQIKYGKWRQVYVSLGNSEARVEENLLLTTTDYPELMLMPENQSNSLSNIMTPLSPIKTQGNGGHIFVKVCYDEVKSELDWRLATFLSKDGKTIFAFDGDALLLKEIYNRKKS